MSGSSVEPQRMSVWILGDFKYNPKIYLSSDLDIPDIAHVRLHAFSSNGDDSPCPYVTPPHLEEHVYT